MKFVQTPSFKLATYAKGGENAERLALVLPGRLDTKDYVHMTSHVDFLANKGFYAVSFDPPFSWESPGDVKDYSTTNYLKAVNELIDQIDKPTLLLGHSRGGAITILASSNPHIKAIAPIMATYGSATIPPKEAVGAGEYTTYRPLPPGSSHADDVKFTLPLTYFIDSQKYNPEAELKKFRGAKLLIYGIHDSFTSPEKVKQVFAELPEPKELLELDVDHDYRYHPEMIAAVNQALGKFADKYFVT